MSFSDNLGQYKMEQLSPIPPKSNDEGAKEQKTRHFGIIEIGGRGGPDVPFILSKIVGASPLCPCVTYSFVDVQYRRMWTV